MEKTTNEMRGPGGGLRPAGRSVRPWRWSLNGALLSDPVRCRQEQWYLLHGVPRGAQRPRPARVLLQFLRDSTVLRQRQVLLSPADDAGAAGPLLGWVFAPPRATHVRVVLDGAELETPLDRLHLHAVAERDPKCHPLANVPRWSVYRPTFPIERIVLPERLAGLAAMLPGVAVETLAAPRSVRKLAAAALGCACVLDPDWVGRLKLSLADIEQIVRGCWLLVDLETYAALGERAGRFRSRVRTFASRHEIMSARVQYADVPTRGFALMDVLPWGWRCGEDEFATRVIVANRSWTRHARATGLSELLTSETPWTDECGDVLSAICASDVGELLVTDLPWIAAGHFGPPLAPRLTAHLLRTHLAQPVEDYVQYWNRWDDCDIVVRDIADLTRRYGQLQAVRWAGDGDRLVRLGIAMTPPRPGRSLMIRTGRIDHCDLHDGLPPEPMVILMRMLVREAAERTPWARRFLEDAAVTWQFESAEGLRYALHYDSAAGLPPPQHTLHVRTALHAAEAQLDERRGELVLPADVGVHGDGSLEFQRGLTLAVRRWIESTLPAGRRR